MKPLITVLTLGLGLVITTTVQAALVDRGGGLIYDTDLNLTWLADANNAMTSGMDGDGFMTWSEATAWAGNLAYGGYTDWRLPTTTCTNSSCDTGNEMGPSFHSEMGHLFHNELGGTANSSISISTDPDLGLFTNVQPTFYWSGTEYTPDTARVWIFDFSYGFQGEGTKNGYGHAWAVRSGDVAAVPLPATAWLFASGLVGLLGMARARRRN